MILRKIYVNAWNIDQSQKPHVKNLDIQPQKEFRGFQNNNILSGSSFTIKVCYVISEDYLLFCVLCGILNSLVVTRFSQILGDNAISAVIRLETVEKPDTEIIETKANLKIQFQKIKEKLQNCNTCYYTITRWIMLSGTRYCYISKLWHHNTALENICVFAPVPVWYATNKKLVLDFL